MLDSAHMFSLSTPCHTKTARARQTIHIRAAWVLACDRTSQFARAVMQLQPWEGLQCVGTLTFMVTTRDGVGWYCMVTRRCRWPAGRPCVREPLETPLPRP